MSADLTIKIQIQMMAKKAKKEAKELTGTIGAIAKSLKLTTDKGTLDLRRMTASFALLGGIAGGFFNLMKNESPGLAVAFLEMNFAMDMIALTLGDVLAPAFQVIADLMNDLSEYIMGLDENAQLFIATMVVATVGLTALAVAIVVVSTVSLPLIAAIIIIAALIAGIVLLIKNWTEVMAWLADHIWIIIGVITIFFPLLGALLAAIVGIIWIVQNWGDIIKWLGEMWLAFVDTMLGVGGSIKEFFTETIPGFFDGLFDDVGNSIAGATIIDDFLAMFDIGDFFEDLWTGILTTFELGFLAIRGFFDDLGFGEEFDIVVKTVTGIFKTMINSITSWINDNVIDTINTVIGFANNILSEDNQIGTLGYLPSFDKGISYVPHDMIAKVHKGEEIIPANVVRQTASGSSGRNASVGGGGGTTINVYNTFPNFGGSMEDAHNIANKTSSAIRRNSHRTASS